MTHNQNSKFNFRAVFSRVVKGQTKEQGNGTTCQQLPQNTARGGESSIQAYQLSDTGFHRSEYIHPFLCAYYSNEAWHFPALWVITVVLMHWSPLPPGQPHEGSIYAIQKDFQMAFHRTEHVRKRLLELERMKSEHRLQQQSLQRGGLPSGTGEPIQNLQKTLSTPLQPPQYGTGIQRTAVHRELQRWLIQCHFLPFALIIRDTKRPNSMERSDGWLHDRLVRGTAFQSERLWDGHGMQSSLRISVVVAKCIQSIRVVWTELPNNALLGMNSSVKTLSGTFCLCRIFKKRCNQGPQ